MTLDQLLDLPPDQAAKMSEAELASYLAPCIPLVRAEYSGKKESTVVLAPGKRTSKKAIENKVQLLLKYMEATKDKEPNAEAT